jgi:hypothetical protein
MNDDTEEPFQKYPPQPPLLELSGRARDVVEALAEHNDKAARLYEAALRVLAGRSKPRAPPACGLRLA